MRRLLIVAFIVVLSGCSVRFAYNWLDWIIPWRIDDYVDLNRSQEKALDRLIEQTLVWHRQNEIPHYLEHIESLTAALRQPMTAEQIEHQLDRFEQHWTRLYNHLLPDFIPLIQTLSDEQVRQILAQVDEDERELRQEYDDMTVEERIERSNKRVLKSFKKRIGKLTDAQVAMVETYNDKRHRSLTYWFSYRDRYIEILAEGLQQRDDTELLRHHLRILLIDYDQLKSPQHVELIEYNRQLSWALLADMQHSLSTKQSNKLLDQLEDLHKDFSYLSKDSK